MPMRGRHEQVNEVTSGAGQRFDGRVAARGGVNNEQRAQQPMAASRGHRAADRRPKHGTRPRKPRDWRTLARGKRTLKTVVIH